MTREVRFAASPLAATLPPVPALASLVVLALLGLSACNSGSNVGGTDGVSKTDFPVNEALAADFTAKGLPLDIAEFLAAAKLDTSRPDPNTFVYRQTFPNGATRDITMKITPNQHYTPTLEESTKVAQGGAPVYDFKFASDSLAGGAKKFQLNYFVPTSGLPPELIAGLQSSALSPEDFLRVALPRRAAVAGETDGAGVSWGEVGKTGADVGIGSLLDYAKENGIPAGALANIYALASAASAIAGALELSKQNGKWFLELAALEDCARNPTNPVTKSDPDYTPNAVSKIEQARNELKEVGSMRFLNQMNETGSGITPQTAVMSIGLKAGFVWSDQTLGDYSENTIMREARLAVVPCGDHVRLDGNVDRIWKCTDIGASQTDVTTTHVVSTVGWIWNPTVRQYHSQGSYIYESEHVTTGGGKTCTYKETAKGSLDEGGALIVYTDAAAIEFLGYDYMASGELPIEADWTDDCLGTSGTAPVTMTWLPAITGMIGTGGGMTGTLTDSTCIGAGASGTEVTKWTFTVPPPE